VLKTLRNCKMSRDTQSAETFDFQLLCFTRSTSPVIHQSHSV